MWARSGCGRCVWKVCVEGVCGRVCVWKVCVEGVCGRCVCGRCVWKVCVEGVCVRLYIDAAVGNWGRQIETLRSG